MTEERRANDKKTCDLIDAISKRLDDHDGRFADGSDRMTRIESKIDANSADTSEVLDILRLGKSFFRILGILGDVVKWGAAVAAPIVALYYAIKTGGKS